MKQINLNSGVFLLVDVPSMAFGFDVNNYGDSSELMYMLDIEEIDESIKHDETLITKKLPPGQWEIIGKGNEITEEAWRGIVEIRRLVGGIHERYTDYKDSSHWFKNPTESGHSWIKSHGMKPEQCILLKLKNK